LSTIEELLERKSSGSGLENRDHGHRGSAALTTRHSSIRKKLLLTSPTSGGRSVGIVRSQTKVTEFSSYVSCAGLWVNGKRMRTAFRQRPFGWPRIREDKSHIDVREFDCANGRWMELAQDSSPGCLSYQNGEPEAISHIAECLFNSLSLHNRIIYDLKYSCRLQSCWATPASARSRKHGHTHPLPILINGVALN
jgi:hypothetical protein